MSPEFILDVTEEEYEKAGSKFAEVGEHLSEMGMPEWETPGLSIRFPFTIIEEGEDKGKESKLVAGVSKNALWKLKEVLKAIGVAVTVKDGKPTFDSTSCVGKQFLTVWTLQKDTRTPEEGGTGGTYSKPTGALAVGESVEDLGV